MADIAWKRFETWNYIWAECDIIEYWMILFYRMEMFFDNSSCLEVWTFNNKWICYKLKTCNKLLIIKTRLSPWGSDYLE